MDMIWSSMIITFLICQLTFTHPAISMSIRSTSVSAPWHAAVVGSIGPWLPGEKSELGSSDWPKSHATSTDKDRCNAICRYLWTIFLHLDATVCFGFWSFDPINGGFERGHPSLLRPAFCRLLKHDHLARSLLTESFTLTLQFTTFTPTSLNSIAIYDFFQAPFLGLTSQRTGCSELEFQFCLNW